MNELKKEQISAFMDGEAQTDEAAIAMSQHSELRSTWGRYHLISDCLKQQCPSHIDNELVDRVASAISDEPAIVAPNKVVVASFLKPVAGFAIAASVTVVAILGIQQDRSGDQHALAPSPQVAAVNNTPAIPTEIQTVNLESGISESAREEADSRLNSYLVNYNEHRTHTGMHGMLPYVRVVAHGKDQ